jgi:DNA polymerase-1
MPTAKEEFKTRVTELLGILKCTKGGVMFAFSSRPYFRKKIEPSYKSNRKQRKPLGYKALLDWACGEWHHIIIPEFEADDVLGVLHTTPQHWPKGTETIVVSNDKDMRTIPGLLYNPDNTDPVETITDEQALRALFIQSLTGDSGDGFGGAKGVGPVKAASIADKALEGAKTIDDVFESFIVPTYVGAGQTADDALTNCRLARILSAADVKIDAASGEWNHELWTPVDSTPTRRRSARRGTRPGRVMRRPVRSISDAEK